MVNRYMRRPYMNAEVLEYLQLRYIKNVSSLVASRATVGGVRPNPVFIISKKKNGRYVTHTRVLERHEKMSIREIRRPDDRGPRATVGTARRDATTTRRDRARRDRASNGACATRREGACGRRATRLRRRARRDSRARFDSNSDWMRCDAIGRDAIRRTSGRRRDED